MRKSNRDNPGKPSWQRRLIGWGPLVLVMVLGVNSYFHQWLLGFDYPGDGHMAISSNNGAVVLAFGNEGGFEGRYVRVETDQIFAGTFRAAPTVDGVELLPEGKIYYKFILPSNRKAPLSYRTSTLMIILPYWYLAPFATLWWVFIITRRARRYAKRTIPLPPM